MRRCFEIAAVSVLFVGMSACASSEPDLVRVRAAGDFACDESRMSVREVREVDAEKTIFQASGCGRVATYACTLTTEPDINPKKRPWPTTSCVRARDEDDAPEPEAP